MTTTTKVIGIFVFIIILGILAAYMFPGIGSGIVGIGNW